MGWAPLAEGPGAKRGPGPSPAPRAAAGTITGRKSEAPSIRRLHPDPKSGFKQEKIRQPPPYLYEPRDSRTKAAPGKPASGPGPTSRQRGRVGRGRFGQRGFRVPCGHRGSPRRWPGLGPGPVSLLGKENKRARGRFILSGGCLRQTGGSGGSGVSPASPVPLQHGDPERWDKRSSEPLLPPFVGFKEQRAPVSPAGTAPAQLYPSISRGWGRFGGSSAGPGP